jgi:hypothetical protein
MPRSIDIFEDYFNTMKTARRSKITEFLTTKTACNSTVGAWIT